AARGSRCCRRARGGACGIGRPPQPAGHAPGIARGAASLRPVESPVPSRTGLPASAALGPVVSELIDLLALERLENNLSRGQSRDIGTRYVFGGQVLGQALAAAQATIDNEIGSASCRERGWQTWVAA